MMAIRNRGGFGGTPPSLWHSHLQPGKDPESFQDRAYVNLGGFSAGGSFRPSQISLSHSPGIGVGK